MRACRITTVAMVLGLAVGAGAQEKARALDQAALGQAGGGGLVL